MLSRLNLVRSSRAIVHFRTLSTKSAAATPAAAVSSGGSLLHSLANELPHKNVVTYQHKNRTWTLHHVDYYSQALAIGFCELGFQSKDIVLSWLPNHLSEQMVLQFACSKAGLLLYTLDPATAITEPETATNALEAALKLSKANILISQEAGNDVDYIRLAHRVIPELRFFDHSSGLPFVTPRFPHVRLCIHTGFDQDDKEGWIPLRHMIVPSNNLSDYVAGGAANHATTPLAGQFVLDATTGVPTGIATPLTNEQVVATNLWPTYTKILQKDYHAVEGVGVIF